MTKDPWDKASIVVQGFTAIAIPLGIAIGTAIYQNKNTDAEERRQWVQIGLDVLRDKDASRELRQWALATINSNAKSPIPEKFWVDFSSGQWTLPPPSSWSISDDGREFHFRYSAPQTPFKMPTEK